MRPGPTLDDNPRVPVRSNSISPWRSTRFLGLAAGLTASLGLVGCGDDPPPPAPAPANTGAAPAPTPKPLPTPSATVKPSSSAPPIASFEPAETGPLRWADFGGPEVVPEVKPGEKAWVVLPVSTGWKTLKFTVLPVARVEEKIVVFEVTVADEKKEALVPGAFVAPIRPADKLAADEAVIIATNGARAFGRVMAAPTDKRVKVRFRFAGNLEEKDVELSETIELDGTLKFAAPVAFSEEKDEGTKRRVIWRPAQLVQTAEDKAWVVNSTGKPQRVPQNTVKPLSVNSLYKGGDKVWAARGDEMVPGEVLEVQDGGTRYKLKLEDGSELTAPFEAVTSPLK